MKAPGLGRMLLSDLRCGLPSVAPRLALVAALAAFGAFCAWNDVSLWLGAPASLSWGDALLGVWGGMEVFKGGEGEEFVLPMAWFALLAVMAYVTLDWPLRDLEGFGARLIVAGGSRWRWWLSKCLWTVVYALAAAAVVAAVCAALVLLTGGSWSDVPSPGYVYALGLGGFGTAAEPAGLGPFALAAVACLVALALLQLAVSLLAGPYLAIAATMALLFVSAYYTLPGLLGDYLMAARTAAVVANGMEPLVGAALALAVAVGAVVGGGALFARRDILGRRAS